MPFTCRTIIAIAVLVAGLIGAERVFAETITEKREAAVLKARAGQTTEAQAELRAMLAAGEEDGFVTRRAAPAAFSRS